MEQYEKLADDLKSVGITKSNMFGMPVLKLGRKPVAGFKSDGVNFKLPAGSDEMKQALSLSGSHLFQPEMHGRKGLIMKQWVVVPFEHAEIYADLAAASIAFVESEMNKPT